MRYLTILATCFVTFASPLAAQEPSNTPTVHEAEQTQHKDANIAPGFSPAAINTMCSERGAFQYAFGELDVPTSSRLEKSMRMSLALPGILAPFENMEPRATPWSRQMAEVQYTTKEMDPDVRFTADDATALASHLDPMLERLGWAPYDGPDSLSVPMYVAAVLGQHTWQKTIPTEDGETVLYFSIDAFAAQLYITCAHGDLMRTLFYEGLGRIPDGTPRPVAPDLPFVPVPDIATCMSGSYSDELDAFMESGRPTNYLGVMLARSNHRAKLAQWIEWRLEQAGIDGDVLFGLMVDTLKLDGGTDSVTASFQALQQLFPALEELADARQSGDETEVCASLVGISRIFERLETTAHAQSAEFERQANIHAERLGISLD